MASGVNEDNVAGSVLIMGNQMGDAPSEERGPYSTRDDLQAIPPPRLLPPLKASLYSPFRVAAKFLFFDSLFYACSLNLR